MARRASDAVEMERMIRAALKAGLKAGEFDVIRQGDKVSVLTHAMREAPSSADQEDEAWAGAMSRWQRSA